MRASRDGKYEWRMRLFPGGRPAGGFFIGMAGFVVEHFVPGAPGAAAFLSSDFFNFSALRGDEAVFLFLDFVEQQPAGEEAVEGLLTGGLAFDLHAGGPVQQHHARGDLVHVLAAVAAGAHEGFLNVRLAHVQGGHALRELAGFFGTDGMEAHAGVAVRSGRVGRRGNMAGMLAGPAAGSRQGKARDVGVRREGRTGERDSNVNWACYGAKNN